MHLRRALLLFAIVLGVAAIAASLAPPPDSTRTPSRTQPQPPATTVEAPEADSRPVGEQTENVRFEAAAESPAERTVETGRHVVVTVTAAEPGEVRIVSLGLVAFATPQTPAVFDLFATNPGEHAISFAPVDGEPKPAGTLVVSG